jgi:AbrB family looped-hinge helix DNA binding protein
MQTVRVAKDYRILIPAKVRSIVPLTAGDELEIKVEKRAAIKLVPKNATKNKGTEIAWNDLMSLSDEITKLWKGPSAVDEIRDQRKKG